MALDSIQRKILHSLMDNGPQTVRELLLSTGVSDTYLRQQLKLMERGRDIELDKKRQPYLYQVASDSPEVQMRATVDKAKQLIRKQIEPNSNLTKVIVQYPKELLPELASTMEAISMAIRELDADGELIDTL